MAITWQDNLTTALNNITAQLADITANPKPTYWIGSQEFKWKEYLEFLVASQEQLRKALAQGSPVEVVGIGVP